MSTCLIFFMILDIFFRRYSCSEANRKRFFTFFKLFDMQDWGLTYSTARAYRKHILVNGFVFILKLCRCRYIAAMVIIVIEI